ncbi:MAG: GNAT family N-acetyltransferase [Nitrospirota bacterium]|nr:GNAT family N-acetyltransferase [Nitrospirota bacterium]
MTPSGRERIVIRPAQVGDLDVLVNFSLAMALETEGRQLDRERLRQGTQTLLEEPARGFYLVAEAQGEPGPIVVGQLMITFEWSDWRNATFWWIQSVYVHPEWRRQGIYRTMHRHVLREAKDRKDVCGLRLYVEKDNQGAQTVYRRVGLSPSIYQVFEEDFVLAKRAEASEP